MKRIVTILTVLIFVPSASFAATLTNTPSYTFSRDLTNGRSGTDVTALQNLLISKGYLSGLATGHFGLLTKKAVIEWQIVMGISPASGYIGAKSRAILNSPISTDPTNTTSTTASTDTAGAMTQAQLDAQNAALGRTQFNPAPVATPPVTTTNSAPVKVAENNSPPVSSWADLENRGFALANQKGWTSLTIPNEAGEKRYYRLEAGTWVRKGTLAEAQQQYQAPLPSPTAAQIAGIRSLCAWITSQGTSEMAKSCADGTVLNGYNTNANFRSGMDVLVQELQQKQAAITQQQANCSAFLGTPYDPQATPETNVQISQAATSNYEACIAGTPAAWQHAGQEIQQSQTNHQLSQLQNSIDANTAATQQMQRSLQEQQSLQQQQHWQNALNQYNTPKQTHCGIDAGEWNCNLPGIQ